MGEDFETSQTRHKTFAEKPLYDLLSVLTIQRVKF